MSASLVRFTIAADPPARPDKALARDVPEAAGLSRTQIARLLEAGAVRGPGGDVLTPRARLAEGDTVEIAIPPVAEQDRLGPEPIALEIVHEDGDIVVVNKPAGMVVHPAPGSPSGTLVNALMHHCGDTLSGIGGERRPGIVHRIDKDTSGLLVVAKSDRAHQGLARQFAEHSVDRLYRAICHGVPDAGDPRLRGVRGVGVDEGGVIRITTQLARHRTDRQRQAVTFSGGRHAVTRLKVLERFAAAALVECRLETGRTHQIRVHMAHAGHGLIGDPIYGGRRRLPASVPGAEAAAQFPRQALHAATLGFVHPVSGEAMRFEAPLPEDMARLLQALRGQSGADSQRP